MNTLKIVKEIKDTNLKELDQYIGKKVEIIINPLSENSEKNLYEALDIISKCSGKLQKWNREELYEQ